MYFRFSRIVCDRVLLIFLKLNLGFLPCGNWEGRRGSKSLRQQGIVSVHQGTRGISRKVDHRSFLATFVCLPKLAGLKKVKRKMTKLACIYDLDVKVKGNISGER